MNIFFLDINPYTCAEYHCTYHNPKMLTEALQIYSTYLRSKGFDYDFLYKSIPQAKEYVKWLNNHEDNLEWFKNLISHLYVVWFTNSSNKNICNTRTYLTFYYFEKNNLISYVKQGFQTPNSFVFRCQKEYHQPDLKNMEECFDLDRVIDNYREFYKWKNNKRQMKWYNDIKPRWIE